MSELEIKIIKIIAGTNCNQCDYDEAKGDLYSHCDECCRKVVSQISELLGERRRKRAKKIMRGTADFTKFIKL